MSGYAELWEEEAATLARARQRLSDEAGALVDALDPQTRRWVLLSLETARRVKSIENWTADKQMFADQVAELPAGAREIVEAANERARERLFRAGVVNVKSKRRAA